VRLVAVLSGASEQGVWNGRWLAAKALMVQFWWHFGMVVS